MNIGIRGEPARGRCGYYRGTTRNTGESGKENIEIRKGHQNREEASPSLTGPLRSLLVYPTKNPVHIYRQTNSQEHLYLEN